MKTTMTKQTPEPGRLKADDKIKPEPLAGHTPGDWEILKQNHNLYIGHKEPSQWATGGFTWEYVTRPIPESRSGAKRGESPSWHGWTAKAEANARLIAAAPQLLRENAELREALRGMLDAYCPKLMAQIARGEFDGVAQTLLQSDVRRAVAALAKAEK